MRGSKTALSLLVVLMMIVALPMSTMACVGGKSHKDYYTGEMKADAGKYAHDTFEVAKEDSVRVTVEGKGAVSVLTGEEMESFEKGEYYTSLLNVSSRYGDFVDLVPGTYHLVLHNDLNQTINSTVSVYRPAEECANGPSPVPGFEGATAGMSLMMGCLLMALLWSSNRNGRNEP